MDGNAVLEWLDEGLTNPLFSIAGTEVTLAAIFSFILILLASFGASLFFQRAADRVVAKRFSEQEGSFAALKRLAHYIIMLVGLGIAMEAVGINMNALFTAGAVFAVAIGFAMQNILQNFLSGVILLVERSIKPGDILEVDGALVRVIDMGIRTTVVRTLKDEDLIIPNSIFSQNTVKNYTLKDNVFTTGVTVGVSYDSDMEKVEAVLKKTVDAMSWRMKKTETRVLLQEFGDSSVNFSVFLSMNDPWHHRQRLSELRKAIWFAFKEADIVIAYPQVDVHFDPPGLSAIGSLDKPTVN